MPHQSGHPHHLWPFSHQFDVASSVWIILEYAENGDIATELSNFKTFDQSKAATPIASASLHRPIDTFGWHIAHFICIQVETFRNFLLGNDGRVLDFRTACTEFNEAGFDNQDRLTTCVMGGAFKLICEDFFSDNHIEKTIMSSDLVPDAWEELSRPQVTDYIRPIVVALPSSAVTPKASSSPQEGERFL